MTVIPSNIVAAIVANRPHLRFLAERGQHRALAQNHLNGQTALSVADTARLASIAGGKGWQ